MISANKSFSQGPIINIGILKSEFPKFYSCLESDELSPTHILVCSRLISKRDDLLEKLIFVYEELFVVLKSVNDKISKHRIEFNDINCIVLEDAPKTTCIAIDYKADLKEKIFFAENSFEIIDSLISNVRRKLFIKFDNSKDMNFCEVAFSDLDENKYPGAAMARRSVVDKQTALCGIKQKRVYKPFGLLFKRQMTQTHFTLLCQNEIIIFLEKSSKVNGEVTGDLIHVSFGSLKNVSVEATGKGMLLKYLFRSGRKLEFFYENERTEQLLKLMSFVNVTISK